MPAIYPDTSAASRTLTALSVVPPSSSAAATGSVPCTWRMAGVAAVRPSRVAGDRTGASVNSPGHGCHARWRCEEGVGGGLPPLAARRLCTVDLRRRAVLVGLYGLSSRW